MSNLSKLNTLDVFVALAPFEKACGDNFKKICYDVKSLLGNVKENEIIAKQSGWKAGAKFSITSKEGYKVQLPANNPATILLCFGMRLNELAEAGTFEVQADIPKACQAWVAQHAKKQEVPA